VLFADAHPVEYTRVILGIGLDTRELENIKVAEQLSYTVVKTYLLDATASIGQKDTLAQGTHNLGQFLYRITTKEESRGGYIIKVLHGLYYFYRSTWLQNYLNSIIKKKNIQKTMLLNKKKQYFCKLNITNKKQSWRKRQAK
jgi:hypothetical protein